MRRWFNGAVLERTIALCAPALALAPCFATPLASCAPRAHVPAVLRLASFKQAGQRGVLLNETLVLHFDAELDASSVTDASVRVVDERGRAARGRLDVHRDRLTFEPALARAPDLSDGGLLPANGYTVVVLGFPRPDGVRAKSGAPLARTYRAGFETVGADPEASERMFDDRWRAHGAPELVLLTPEVRPRDPIVVVSAAPVDPRTLQASDFRLVRIVGAGSDEPQVERIDVQPSLARNEPFRAEGAATSRDPADWPALIELLPRTPDGAPLILEIGEYHLSIDGRTLRLRDLGGRAVQPVPSMPPTFDFRVVLHPEGQRHREDFLDASGAAPEPVPGADGLARWSERGTVRVRLPRAAGAGSDGAVELAGALAARDVHATRLVVPSDAVATLPPWGTVVLRAQRDLRVAGELRRVTWSNAGPYAASALERLPRPFPDFASLARASAPVPDEPPAALTLSSWLAQGACEAPWTVLVAGGDLVVEGTLDVHGPLLLVAGGWIRIAGEVVGPARAVWKLGEGGGTFRQIVLSKGDRGTKADDEWVIQPGYALYAQLELDEVTSNPLREPLRVAVYSTPISPRRGVERWHRAIVSGRHGIGRFSVSYVGERTLPSGELEVSEPVFDPVLLEGYGALRLLIELEVPPGATWDPPVVDYVELSWDEPGETR